MTLAEVTQDKAQQEKIKLFFLDVIKGLAIEDLTVPDENHKKWFRFGAYEFGRELAEKIKGLK